MALPSRRLEVELAQLPNSSFLVEAGAGRVGLAQSRDAVEAAGRVVETVAPVGGGARGAQGCDGQRAAVRRLTQVSAACVGVTIIPVAYELVLVRDGCFDPAFLPIRVA
jgi:hypothetical protein